MIYDNNALNVLYKDYSNINQKICLETKNGNLIRIKRGLYTDNLKMIIAIGYRVKSSVANIPIVINL